MAPQTWLYRVGHVGGPLLPPPWQLCGWQGRFDDAFRSGFRTLYTAPAPATALAEVLAPLRPAAKAMAEAVALFGAAEAKKMVVGTVSENELHGRCLVHAELVLDSGKLVNLRNLAVRTQLEQRFAAVLANYGVAHLDVGDATGHQRDFTQMLASRLFENSYAGIQYISAINAKACFALFEHRAHLKPATATVTDLASETQLLTTVCKTLGLKLIA